MGGDDERQGRIALEDVRRAEIDAINRRRQALKRPLLSTDLIDDGKGRRRGRSRKKDDNAVVEAVGLALSGGGIRSAAFSLGVLQALNQQDVIKNIDYLSTVSGGGYIGTALTATMTKTGGTFVFGRKISAKPGSDHTEPPASDVRDTDEVGQIRNYSNYLIPMGGRDVLTGLAIIMRGLVANLSFVLPVVLCLAALTIFFNPTLSSLRSADIAGVPLDRVLPIAHFGITLFFSVIGLVGFFVWSIWRSYRPADELSEFRTRWPAIGAGYLVFVAFVAFCEFQPFVLAGMFEAANAAPGSTSNAFVSFVANWVRRIAALLAPIAVLVMFFRQRLASILESVSPTSRMTMKLAALLTTVAVWLAGLALPLIIWVLYLHLSYWGIANDFAQPVSAVACQESGVEGSISIKGTGLDVVGDIEGTVSVNGADPCPESANGSEPASAVAPVDPVRAHAPQWLSTPARWVDLLNGTGSEETSEIARQKGLAVVLLYFCAGLLIGILAVLLKPNANSLHRLYRDRLSKAFLFDPSQQRPLDVKRNDPSVDQGRDFAQVDRMKLSELSAEAAPYHLINAALNIQGSDYANRRGRNADFFLFSPRHVGSASTGYAKTNELEEAAPSLDLATAMAISGAAASSNMGSISIKALTPTLALLNVRLGYWLSNPRYAHDPGESRQRNSLYLWAEITGRLYENSDAVYLTDGGHIENLGVYELLRRRCRLIIVVDAEGDADMRFTSLIALQRYARIDLGVRIDLPFDPISEMTRAWMAAGVPKKGEASAALKASAGPHIAVGRILYGGSEEGYLLYVKSSLTGDEADYVRDYGRRFPQFPHETTGDQFFSEEQFEVYRALGFHAMFGFLEADNACVVISPKITDKSVDQAAGKKSPADQAAAGGGAVKTADTGYKRWETVSAGSPRLKPVRNLLGLK